MPLSDARPGLDDARSATHYHLQILLYHGMPGSGRQYNANENGESISRYFRPFFSHGYYRGDNIAYLPGCNGDRPDGPRIRWVPDVIVPMHEARSKRLGTYLRIPDGLSEAAGPKITDKTSVSEHFGDDVRENTFAYVYVKRIVIITPPDVWLNGSSSMTVYTDFLDDMINTYTQIPEEVNEYPRPHNLYRDISHIWGELDKPGRPDVGRIRCNLKKLWSTRNSSIYEQKINFWNNYATTYFETAKAFGVSEFGGSDSGVDSCPVSAISLIALPHNISGADAFFSCGEFGGS